MTRPDDRPVAASIVRATVGVPSGAGQATVTASLITTDGGIHDVASWAAEVPRRHQVTASRSPDRSLLAVVVHETLVVVDLDTGEVSAPRAATPPAGALLAADPRTGTRLEDRDRATPWITWPVADAAPAVVFPGEPGPVRVALEPGWELELSGGVRFDGGHCGDMGSSPARLVWSTPVTAEEQASALAEVREKEATAAARPEHVVFSAVRDGVRTVIHDAIRTPLQGLARLHWPPVVGPAGVLLRHSVETVTLPPDEYAGTDTRMQHPWLVGRDGSVRTIPTQLGVSPLCALPDGRLLLRGADALWLDGRDEPVHVLGLDGRLEALAHRGADVTASGLLALLAPDLLPDEPPEEPDDARWGLEDAHVDEARGELVLLVAENPWDTEHDADPNRWGPEHDADDHPRAVVVALPLDGEGDPRLLAREQRTPGHHVSFAL